MQQNKQYLKYKFEDIFSSKGRTKIIKILACEEELNISKIVQITHLNHKTVESHLKVLISAGLIQEKHFGRIRIFRFKIENILASSLKKMIEFWDEWNCELS